MNTKEMLEKYPELFGSGDELNPQKTLMVFGIETGKGWKDVILSYLPKISEIVKEKKLDNFRIVQIKEKFGSLRVYTNNSVQEIEDIIDEMEKECSTTCETCGSKEGKFRSNGWMRVICDECENK